jgi:hypothetical protein
VTAVNADLEREFSSDIDQPETIAETGGNDVLFERKWKIVTVVSTTSIKKR